MKIGDVEVGDCFVSGDQVYMRTDLFTRGDMAYIAVDQATGKPAFGVGVSSNIEKLLAHFDMEVELVAKSKELKSKVDEIPKIEQWSQRYDTKGDRALGEIKFRAMFPGIEPSCENLEGAFLLVAEVSPAMHGRIKEQFGGT